MKRTGLVSVLVFAVLSATATGAPSVRVPLDPSLPWNWIASTIARKNKRLLLWVIGAVDAAHGQERVDPTSAFRFPLTQRRL